MTESDRLQDDDSLVELDPSQAEAFLDRTRAGGKEGDGASGEEPPPEIPGFVITGVLGRGATGVVYRARQEAVDREVALKALHPHLVTNVRAVKRLKREARLAARLAHPSIISSIDMGEVDGLWWYAMELVEGVPLSRRIAERGALTEREVLRLFSPLCDALQHAHEVGIVHRDIKPANILIDGRGRARLVDLGLAVGRNDPSITRTGATLGTPHYVSPEQARDPAQADIRSDLWSLGATMYHAVCGRPPFQPDGEGPGGVAEVLARVLHERVEDPRALAPGLSRDFALMLRKCLTRDPAQRYQEPWELVADIERLRERRRLDLRGSQLDPYASRRPRWWRGARAGALIAVAVGLTWAFTARPWEAPAAPEETTREASLEDWPELLAVDQAFARGALSHAAALAELEGPASRGLPAAARRLHDQLSVDLKRDLADRARRCLQESEDASAGRLAVHDFDGAADAAEGGLDARLSAATGFSAVSALPEGAVRLGAEAWRREQLERVREARGRARSLAAAGLRNAYPEVVGRRVASLLAASRWRDAMDLLDEPTAAAWLELPGLELDLRGLDASERAGVAREIEPLVTSDRSNVRYRMASAVEEAADFVEAERQSLLDRVRDGDVKGERAAVASFAEALAAKHASLGLDPDQLTEEFRAPHLGRVAEVTRELAVAESLRREALASAALAELEVTLRPLRERRDYGAVGEALDAALAEGWRRSTFPALRARLREVALLEGLLERAAAGIEAADGEEVELHFERIPVSGRIGAEAGAVLRRGFLLESGRADRLRVELRPTPETARGAARLLEAADLLRLAGVADGAGASPADQLLTAAFLAAEGDPEGARRRIRLQDHPAEDLLPADLERRVRGAIEEPVGAARPPGSAAAADQARAPSALAGADRPSLRDAFGVPNQASVGRRARLVWDLVDDGSGPRLPGLRAQLPTGSARLGAWEPGRWTLGPGGLALRSDLGERADFLSGTEGPHLALRDPLNLQRPLRVRVHLRPVDHRPGGHLVALSLRGYHLLLDGDRLEPRAWFGTGDLRALVAHVRDGAGAAPDGFRERPFAGLVDGEEVLIDLELRGSTLERLEVDGEAPGFPRFLEAPRADDPFLRVRSAKPVTLLDVDLQGERRPKG